MALGPFTKKDHVEITSLGTEFAVAEILGAGLGYWLDNRWNTTPWFLILGVFAGFGLGFYIILRAVKTMEAEQQKKETK